MVRSGGVSNVRFYAFDALNGVTVIVEYDYCVVTDGMLLCFEEYGGRSSTEAFSKFVQADKGTFLMPWLAYRLRRDQAESLAGQLGRRVLRVVDYYSADAKDLRRSVDASLLDLLLGEVGAYTKLFLFTPFETLYERTWFRLLYGLLELLKGSNSGSDIAASKVESAIHCLIESLKKTRAEERFNGLRDCVEGAEEWFINSVSGDSRDDKLLNLASNLGKLSRFHPERGNVKKYNAVFLILPVIYIPKTIDDLAGILALMLRSGAEVYVYTPWHSGSGAADREIHEALMRKITNAKIYVKNYNIDVSRGHISVEQNSKRIIDEIWDIIKSNRDKQFAVVVVMDAVKALLRELAERFASRRPANADLFVAAPGIGVERSSKGFYITGSSLVLNKLL